MFLSVIIPAYNEEKRLPETLEKIKNYLSQKSYDCEVLIVNDGSKDKTAEIVLEQIKDWPNFDLLDNQENKGKGGVVKQGMLAAKGDWRLLMDADNSTDISEIEKLFNFTEENSKHETRSTKPIRQAQGRQNQNLKDQNYEIVIGSRYLNKDSIKVKQPLGRRIVSRLGNWLIRIVLGIKSVDTQCGFKLFSAEAANKTFPLQTIDRWGFDMEVLAIAIRKGYQIKEVAIDWYDAEGSQVKKSAAWKTLKELFEIKWNSIIGKYR